MGLEATCMVTRGDARTESRVLLETDEVVVRGELRTRIPFHTMTRVSVQRGTLSIQTAHEVVDLELGAVAAKKWLDRISNPRSRLDKLGVKPGLTVSVLGDVPEDFRSELMASGAVLSEGKAQKESDIICLFANEPSALRRLPALVKSIQRNGAIWVVHPRGQKTFLDTHVFAAARAAGLTDVKVARFSETQTAEKLVIPVARR